MEIKLKKMELRNFKGIREMVIDFNESTDILGQNATGKTTIVDAFLWLLFGKDSSDRTDFEIKTLDENNQPFHRLDHEVSALLSVDQEELLVRKTFKEKWVTKKGEKEPVFSGHENNFYWNDVPMKESEFKVKIAAILDEKVFKLITNTTYFNSLKWQDRRNVLLQIAGPINSTDILKSIMNGRNDSQVYLLKAALNANKSIDEYKREIAAKKKKIKDDLDLIPARIDEANRSLPDPKDYTAIETQISEVESEISNIDSLLNNKSKAHKAHQDDISLKIKEVSDLRNQNMTIEFSEKNSIKDKKQERESAIQEKKRTLRTKQDELNRSRTDYTTEVARMEAQEVLVKGFRDQYISIDAEKLEFKEGEFCCPACKREFEPDQVESKKETLTANFNKNKSTRLKDVAERGTKAAEEVKVVNARIENIKAMGMSVAAEVDTLNKDIATLEEQHQRLSENEAQEIKTAIAGNTIYLANNEKIDLLTEQINTPYTAESNNELVDRKYKAVANRDSLKEELSSKGQREKTLSRIDQLTDQEKTLAQELADLEGTEFAIEQFVKAKMDTLEERINGRFKIVRFKMFEEQINGGQVEACTTLIDGVPFSDANTAKKIAAGIDIINTLSDHYGVTAPIFIDNRESVINIPGSKSQIINLIVSAKHKKLTVGDSKEKMAVA